MSKYTIELRNVINLYGADVVKSWFTDYDLNDYLTPDEISVINTRATWNKEKLAGKILDHYYFKEIGLETPAMFSQRAKIKMREIMEEYLPLIYSASIKYDVLVNVDYTETYNRTIDNTTNNTSNSTSNSTSRGTSVGNSSGLTINSDTPQGRISKSDILDGTYASSTTVGENTQSDTTDTINNSSTDVNDHGNSSATEGSTKRVKGNSGVSATAQAMVKQYRQNIIAIDRKIIEELNSLFFGLY